MPNFYRKVRRMVTANAAIGVALMLAVSGCSTNPVTGKSEFSLVSAQGEVAIGQQNFAPYQQQQGGRYVVDPELTLYVKEVGMKIAKLSDRPGLPYDFVVLNNDVPNAWALPGGKIAINRGLLLHMEDEAQLAAVLAHEIVHAAARHGALQMTQQQILGVGAMAAGIASSDSEYGPYIAMAAMGSTKVYHAHHSRTHEFEADRYGIEYMARAGYDAWGAVELQETFLRMSQGRQADFFQALLATHPPSAERVAQNKENASKYSGGLRNRERYQRAIAQIKKDQPAYEQHQKALQAAGKKDYAAALSGINAAIKAQPDEALFYVSRGQIELQQKNYSAAEKSFQSAYNRNPDYVMPALGLGLAQKARSKNALAKTHLQKSLRLLPTPIAMYHLGEIEQAEGNGETAAKYYQQVAQSGGALGTAAADRLKQMGYAQTAPQPAAN